MITRTTKTKSISSEVRRPVIGGAIYVLTVLASTAAIFGVLGLIVWGLSLTDPNRDERPMAEQIRSSWENDLTWLKVSCPPIAADADRVIADPASTREDALGVRMRAKVIMTSPVKGQVCSIYTPSEIRRQAR